MLDVVTKKVKEIGPQVLVQVSDGIKPMVIIIKD
jgi:hypothetical protein